MHVKKTVDKKEITDIIETIFLLPITCIYSKDVITILKRYFSRLRPWRMQSRCKNQANSTSELKSILQNIHFRRLLEKSKISVSYGEKKL